MARKRREPIQAALLDVAPPPSVPRRTNLPEPWCRVDGGTGKLGATYRHASGWVIQHCGHPTANYPYALYNPEGFMVLAPNGRAWRNLVIAAAHVATQGGVK